MKEGDLYRLHACIASRGPYPTQEAIQLLLVGSLRTSRFFTLSGQGLTVTQLMSWRLESRPELTELTCKGARDFSARVLKFPRPNGPRLDEHINKPCVTQFGSCAHGEYSAIAHPRWPPLTQRDDAERRIPLAFGFPKGSEFDLLFVARLASGKLCDWRIDWPGGSAPPRCSIAPCALYPCVFFLLRKTGSNPYVYP